MSKLISYAPQYLEAIALTLKLAFSGILLALVLGYLMALAIHYRITLASTLSRSMVALSRNTPLAIQLFFLYYGLPKIGLQWSEWTCAIVGIAFIGSGYMTQGMVSGLKSVDLHQFTSAKSLGLSPLQIHLFVELPQALVYAMPHITANILFLTKETSVVSAIAVAELLYVTKDIIGMYYDTVQALSMLVLSYLVILLPLTGVLQYLERRVRHAVFGL